MSRKSWVVRSAIGMHNNGIGLRINMRGPLQEKRDCV